MDFQFDPQALFIIKTLKTAGFEVYLVGGAVRDLLSGAKITDYDFTTNATPEQILALFPDSFYENEFGTVNITSQHLAEMEVEQKTIDLKLATKVHESLKHQLSPDLTQNSASQTSSASLIKQNFQITTFRSDGIYKDFRRPESVAWGQSLKEDLKRRDFTINALALDIDPQTQKSQLIDYHHGADDLKNSLIKTVDNPDKRFNEDALRMLRAVRFSVQLNFKIDDQTFKSINKNSPLLSHISAERIRDELLKILNSRYPAEGIELLDQSNLLQFILPELLLGKGVAQGGHHNTDVWTHSLDALRNCPSSDPIVRLATLLHDIAKPQTSQVINGQITSYNHELIGARVAKNIGRRLRLSSEQIDRLFILVRFHMFHYQPQMTDAAIRRFMRQVGLNNINDILDLREADRLGSGAKKTSWRLEEMKQRMIDQLHQPMEVKDLAINGYDLMKEFNLKPGPALGQILHQLFEKVLDDPELNQREKLLNLVHRLSNSI